jgi:ribose transport system permease protein
LSAARGRPGRGLAYAWPAVAATALLLALNTAADPSFGRPASWAPILAVATPFMLVAMAEAPAILSGNGGLDLSVGPLAGVVNAALVALVVPAGLASPAALVGATLAIGLAAGALNGTLVVVFRIPPIIATLGTYLIHSSLALEILPTAGGKAPDWLVALTGARAGVPLMLAFPAAVALVWVPLRRTAFGRNLLAVGGDQRAAFASGVPVGPTRFLAYVTSGVLAATAGLAFTAVLGSGDPTVAPPYTLIGIAGAVLGGVGLGGGRGGLLGAAAGGVILFLVQNLLSLAHVSSFYMQIAYGALLLGALALNSLEDAWRRRREPGTA